ncbi:MAG TPA: class I SAM-dependent methyltransferase [Dongiaceae bacterium]|nr:class I SAM-dependent methyltransferase [Dongiaceae bacterium]
MNFSELVDRICAQSPLQEKKLRAYLVTRDAAFFCEANDFIDSYGGFLAKQNISVDYAVGAYLEMCKNMMRCQVEFMRSGKYPSAALNAKEMVYQNSTEMLSYMVGLGISQFLWSTHYEMFNFLKAAFQERADNTESYLEIGPGHGLFLEQALRTLHRVSNPIAIDISETSLGLTRSIIDYSVPDRRDVQYILADILEADLSQKFDFVTMGEVLEHVEQPQLLLRRVKNMLAPGGGAFVSTCVNCPAIDHVYQFNTVEQIRALLTDCGLAIKRDLPLPVEKMTVEAAEKNRITINYCALLE